MARDRAAASAVRDLGRANNLGFLRLMFAALVVVWHSPDLVGAPSLSEPLRSVFGTISAGEVSVDAFFIISGYLITKSFYSPQPLSRFLLSRVLRIYPGYIVAFLLSFYLVGWLGDGDLSSGLGWNILRQLRTMVLLQAPNVHDLFPGLAHPEANGPMWSLAEEFRCYCLVVILGFATVLRRQAIFAALVALGLYLLTFHSFGIVRMASIFVCGMAFYIFRDRIRYHWSIACLAFVGWCATMFSSSLCEPGTALFGGYLIFWFAFNVRSQALSRIGRTTDLSYGLYLYAWPIANLIVYYIGPMGAWALTAATIPLAAAAGYLSWKLIEHPALALKDNAWLLARIDRSIAHLMEVRPPTASARGTLSDRLSSPLDAGKPVRPGEP